MPRVDLKAGAVDYLDTGGDGPVLVLLHGLVTDASLWRHVVAGLRADYRCVVPTLPLGSHRQAMRHGADLTLGGQARLVAEFMDTLGLRGATVAQNGAAVAVALATLRPDLVSRLVLIACEAFGHHPYGRALARIPGGLNLAFRLLRVRPLRRLPPFGLMSMRVPHGVSDGWLRPLWHDREVRRDLRAYLLAATNRQLAEATGRLRSFTGPALVVWATEDRLIPAGHGERLTALLPDARLVEIGDSYTLIPEDQPRILCSALRRFLEPFRDEA
ncbi:alpha/beta fold hydrolase [Nonomuraea soli]|uniref:Pimeloyl-ACP methyl ester carboxylesterase n=1 Tax=Nonomuraea soli TaxID=1032476 RepID=A0A7W0CTC4_9ACTN|nr:alpha/beta hydrolase [Nonomuraea soli]MBA2896765.1 pimeloyl-ACP methyl ester carboxylesterase [Nonomuraea soli]